MLAGCTQFHGWAITVVNYGELMITEFLSFRVLVLFLLAHCHLLLDKELVSLLLLVVPSSGAASASPPSLSSVFFVLTPYLKEL